MKNDIEMADKRDLKGLLADKYPQLIEKIGSLIRTLDPMGSVNVAIDGNSGAGKSTLAAALGAIYDSNIFHMDDFFLTPELKTPERLKEPGGNVDYLRFREEILEKIRLNVGFTYRSYDCKRMAMGEGLWVNPKRINIIEGVYSLHPTLINNYNLRIFLSIDPKRQSRRILERNGPFMHKRFIKEWIPLENEYFTKLSIKDRCHLIYDV